MAKARTAQEIANRLLAELASRPAITTPISVPNIKSGDWFRVVAVTYGQDGLSGVATLIQLSPWEFEGAIEEKHG